MSIAIFIGIAIGCLLVIAWGVVKISVELHRIADHLERASAPPAVTGLGADGIWR